MSVTSIKFLQRKAERRIKSAVSSVPHSSESDAKVAVENRAEENSMQFSKQDSEPIVIRVTAGKRKSTRRGCAAPVTHYVHGGIFSSYTEHDKLRFGSRAYK